MTAVDLNNALLDFVTENGFNTKGSLAVGILVTERARVDGLPLQPNKLLTKGGGQVSGLGSRVVQTVLSRNGVNRVLSRMGGRTNRASPEQMHAYVAFLNALHDDGAADLDVAEKFWVEQVNMRFAAMPLTLALDPSRSLRSVVRDILAQAQQRQAQSPGMQYAGAVLQHLVGAKLDCALGETVSIAHHSNATADEHSGRAGDFVIADTAIHVTTAPSEDLIERCRENINDGVRPVIVTTSANKGLDLAEGLAGVKGLADRIDVFEAEQFIALNLYELGGFADSGRRVVIDDLVKRYNEIVDLVETDPAMRIAVKKRKVN